MTDPEAPEDQQLVNRKALHYTFRWVAEEDRPRPRARDVHDPLGPHRRGKSSRPRLLRERKDGLRLPLPAGMAEGFIYLALQEEGDATSTTAPWRGTSTSRWLKAISRQDGAPTRRVTARSSTTCLIKSFKGRPRRAVSQDQRRVAGDFRMPVQNNLLNYRRQFARHDEGRAQLQARRRVC